VLGVLYSTGEQGVACFLFVHLALHLFQGCY
jgi:hypothetical protein